MAAGLGFKTFTTGEVLTAADTNGYLMQGVLVFASAAARDAAITSPQEGQCCYLKDTDAVLTYSGAAWVGFDDSNAIQNTIVDAKGDIVAASGSDTPARLAVGNNGETLVADSSQTTGLRYKEDYAAGKNKFINGAFDHWQRGTTFSISTGAGTYTADRFAIFYDGSGATRTVSQQTFTPGTAPVAGYEGQYFYRMDQTVAGTGASYNYPIMQKIEDVRTFAGQTITFSFWAKADAARTVTVEIDQLFGSGGSAGVVALTSGSLSVTTAWQRFTVSGTLPSVSGKTIGTGSSLNVFVMAPLNTVQIFDTWGWQIEESPVATAFQTATGTLQGELAACQRYFVSFSGDASIGLMGAASTSTVNRMPIYAPTVMRTTPSATYSGTIQMFDGSNLHNVSSIGTTYLTQNVISQNFVTAAVLTGFRPYQVYLNNGSISFSSEL